MATMEKPQEERRSAIPRAYDVMLQIRVENECGQQQLEELSLDVLEAIEEHAAQIVVAPVVSGSFASRAIDLNFTVCASTPSQLHRHLADVVTVLEDRTPMTILSVSHATPASEDDERELVPA